MEKTHIIYFHKIKILGIFFENAGVDVNNPKYGSWWDRGEHQRKSSDYNREWSVFIENNPNATKEEILNFGRQQASKYGLEINF